MVPGHANALLGVYPETGHPQVVFCDRHLVLGGTGLDNIRWNWDQKTLSGNIQLVGDDPTELVIAVPIHMTLDSVAVEPDVTINAAPAGNHSWAIKLQAPASRNVHWSLSFKPIS
jgi:hypothetical protein